VARQTQDILNGYAFVVSSEELPMADQNGEPLTELDGSPKTEQITRVIFKSADGTHVVIVPLNESGRDRLVAQLTGGIVIANGQVLN